MLVTRSVKPLNSVRRSANIVVNPFTAWLIAAICWIAWRITASVEGSASWTSFVGFVDVSISISKGDNPTPDTSVTKMSEIKRFNLPTSSLLTSGEPRLHEERRWRYGKARRMSRSGRAVTFLLEGFC